MKNHDVERIHPIEFLLLGAAICIAVFAFHVAGVV